MAKPKTDSAKNITAVVGSDEGTVKATARELADQLTPADAGESAWRSSTARPTTPPRARRASTRPSQPCRRCPSSAANWCGSRAPTSWRTAIGRSNGVLEALEILLELLQNGLAPEVRFLLSATETDKRRTFYKGLSKVAEMHVFDKLDSSKSGWEEEAAALVAQRARARDLEFSGEASELFTSSRAAIPARSRTNSKTRPLPRPG